MSGSDTRLLILNAAERAFAEQGFAAVSIRQVVARAGVNLAAVHYHFGSKSALIEAVFSRRLQPINARRLEMLDTLEGSAGAESPPLEGVVRALIEPMLDLRQTDGDDGRIGARIYGRVIAEPNDDIQEMLRSQLHPVIERFTVAFSRALPDLPRAVLLWRIYYSVGATAHVMCDPARFKQLSGGICDPADVREVVRQLVTFLTAGLRAPVL
jgi:AcrR family transcriptional regulator